MNCISTCVLARCLAKTKKGKRGEDYFVGEKELEAYLARSTRDAATRKPPSRADTGDDANVASETVPVPSNSIPMTHEAAEQQRAPPAIPDTTAGPAATPQQATPTATEQISTPASATTPVHPTTQLRAPPASPSAVNAANESVVSSAPAPAAPAAPRTTVAKKSSTRLLNESPHSGLDRATRSDDDESKENVDVESSPARVRRTRRAPVRYSEEPRDLNDVEHDDINHPAETSADEHEVLDSGDKTGDGVWDDSDDGESASSEDEGEENEEPPSVAIDTSFYRSWLEPLGGEEAITAGLIDDTALREMSASGWKPKQAPDSSEYMAGPHVPSRRYMDVYPGLQKAVGGTSHAALQAADSPLGAFLFLLPIELWSEIADKSNDYHLAHIKERAKTLRQQQLVRERKKPGFKALSVEELQGKLEKEKPVMVHELLVFIGLLIARAVSPNREKLTHHWKRTDEGAIPRGCFGAYMVRDRFLHICKNLHFSSNDDPRASEDRAWKLRPVINTLQRTFRAGCDLPPVISFDEAMLPSRSSFNRMRVYMKDKPHKWGTKLYMVCCARTAYCIRLEVYCGKNSNATSADKRAGPAAVVRNLRAVMQDEAPRNEWRLVVTDRFYTSVALALQLLTMKFYSLGTIQTNRPRGQEEAPARLDQAGSL